ncbi:hypothetical protein SAMN05444159_0747 [Bradyrhizobium lablabi]|uniref:Uncharacterized protein n=1 Tax=Bradyrhizobium lablabi TaxID=722472 RepID=A0A1M6JQF9_9BRAD|nr:hypothetical protein SAMN05444159_0747 [Bradyrhizobium lablabi]
MGLTCEQPPGLLRLRSDWPMRRGPEAEAEELCAAVAVWQPVRRAVMRRAIYQARCLGPWSLAGPRSVATSTATLALNPAAVRARHAVTDRKPLHSNGPAAVPFTLRHRRAFDPCAAPVRAAKIHTSVPPHAGQPLVLLVVRRTPAKRPRDVLAMVWSATSQIRLPILVTASSAGAGGIHLARLAATRDWDC